MIHCLHAYQMYLSREQSIQLSSNQQYMVLWGLLPTEAESSREQPALTLDAEMAWDATTARDATTAAAMPCSQCFSL